MGAEVVGEGTHFRVYAPKRARVTIVFDDNGRPPLELAREASGYFSGLADGARAGDLYSLRLDGDDRLVPDPASRFQPDGPHGPSEVIDPSHFAWTDGAWRGARLEGQILYEMHIGTYTPSGTFAAATRELEELRGAGLTLIEVMPIHEFPGRFGWGYDGVDLYAPTHLYGRPDDVRAFVDRAHALGLGVILDVVYNHLGPSGNYLGELSDHLFTDRYANEWGDAIDFETDPGVRRFFAENGAYWVDEFHFDGLRLDATQCIFDRSSEHVITELARRARAAAGARSIVVFAESDTARAALARPVERGGHGLDAVWNDDFHHSARVAATGRAEAYYGATKGTAQELLSAVERGYLFQGQRSPLTGRRRGEPAFDLPAAAFTVYLENHDQVSNSLDGARLHQLTSPGVHRALTALLLLAPTTPLVFQGQEFASSKPFVFFADHEPGLAPLVAEGRRAFLARFPSLAGALADVPEPNDPATFERCKLDLSERVTHRAAYALFRDLLRLRRGDPAFRAQDRARLDGAVLGPRAFVLRFGLGTAHDRLLVVNLDDDLDIGAIAEPLVAPPPGARWELVLSTEDPRYGGAGTPGAAPGDASSGEALPVPGRCALVLRGAHRDAR